MTVLKIYESEVTFAFVLFLSISVAGLYQIFRYSTSIRKHVLALFLVQIVLCQFIIIARVRARKSTSALEFVNPFTTTLPASTSISDYSSETAPALEWQEFPLHHVDKYFSEFEMRSLGLNRTYLQILREDESEPSLIEETKNLLFSESLRTCDSKYPPGCCMGSSSTGGGMFWKAGTCRPFHNGISVPTNYFKRLVPKGTKDPSTIRYHTMADVIDVLGNRTLLFAGDSVMGQIYQYSECSWLRSSFLGNGEPPKVVARLSGTQIGQEKNWKYYASHGGVVVESHKGVRSEIHFIAAYRPEDDFNNIYNWVEQKKPDVLFINWGLHYLIYENSVYIDMIVNLLTKLRVFATNQPLIFRETSAQHLVTDGGEWDSSPAAEWNVTEDLAQSCRPLRFIDHGDPYDEPSLLQPTIRKWRDRIVIREAILLGYKIHVMDAYYLKEHPHIVKTPESATCKFLMDNDDPLMVQPTLFIIPFYDWTEDLWDAHHTNDNGKCEPTHYCSNPLVWEHIYDRMYGILKHSKPFCDIA